MEDITTQSNKWARHALIAAALLAAGAFTPGAQAQGSQGNPTVLPPNSKPFGYTYGEWLAKDWHWLYSMPATANPLFDTAPISAGQSGPVWFLGATFALTVDPSGNIVGTANRTGTIPAGTALYVPLIDAECSILEGNGTAEADLRTCAESYFPAATLFCEVDGQALQSLFSYYKESPLYTFGPLPADNPLYASGLTSAVAGSTSPSVATGYAVILAPLPVGTHTLHFGGSIPGFMLDITYHITVQ